MYNEIKHITRPFDTFCFSGFKELRELMELRESRNEKDFDSRMSPVL
jgi:hypothetical protein